MSLVDLFNIFKLQGVFFHSISFVYSFKRHLWVTSQININLLLNHILEDLRNFIFQGILLSQRKELSYIANSRSFIRFCLCPFTANISRSA